MDTHLDLLYSNSIWRQSSIPTSILMEELSSGYVDSVCTTISISLLISFSLLLIVARRKYLNRSEWRDSATFCTSQRDTLHVSMVLHTPCCYIAVHYQSKVLNVRLLLFFLRSLLLTKPAFIWSKDQQKKLFFLFKRTFLFEYIIKYNLFLWFQSWILSIISPVTWSLRNHSNILICCSKNMLKIAEYNSFRIFMNRTFRRTTFNWNRNIL